MSLSKEIEEKLERAIDSAGLGSADQQRDFAIAIASLSYALLMAKSAEKLDA